MNESGIAGEGTPSPDWMMARMKDRMRIGLERPVRADRTAPQPAIARSRAIGALCESAIL